MICTCIYAIYIPSKIIYTYVNHSSSDYFSTSCNWHMTSRFLCWWDFHGKERCPYLGRYLGRKWWRRWCRRKWTWWCFDPCGFGGCLVVVVVVITLRFLGGPRYNSTVQSCSKKRTCSTSKPTFTRWVWFAASSQGYNSLILLLRQWRMYNVSSVFAFCLVNVESLDMVWMATITLPTTCQRDIPGKHKSSEFHRTYRMHAHCWV
jgi:hypothetical protein